MHIPFNTLRAPAGRPPFCVLCFLCRDSLRGQSLMNLDWCFVVVWPQRQTFVRLLLQLQNWTLLLRAEVRRIPAFRVENDFFQRPLLYLYVCTVYRVTYHLSVLLLCRLVCYWVAYCMLFGIYQNCRVNLTSLTPWMFCRSMLHSYIHSMLQCNVASLSQYQSVSLYPSDATVLYSTPPHVPIFTLLIWP